MAVNPENDTNMETNKSKEIDEKDESPLLSPIMFDEASMDLLSKERLDQSSPELWPEQIPGVSEFASLLSPESDNGQQPEWLKDLDHDDISVLQGFGSLTAAALLEKVKELQNLAYQLGLEEAREMTRGRFLNILSKNNNKRWNV